MTTDHIDVAIIGAGPAGSCLASFLAEAGHRVAIVEKAEFPRFHVGESLTGIAGDVLRELDLFPAFEAAEFPKKRGVKVIGRDSEFFVPVLGDTFQVRRSEFDRLLLERARRSGAARIRGEVRDVVRSGESVVGLRYRPDGEAEDRELACRFVADASGQAIVLSKLGVAGKRELNPRFDRQVALFTHIEGAGRDPGQMGDNTFIFYAKLHHWAWFIPISPTVTSVGVVMPNEVFRPLGGADAAMAWGLEHINPNLRERVIGRPWVEPVRAAFNYSYQVAPFAGDGWLCVGDSHGFVDPIFSFGVAIAIQEAREASRRITNILAGAEREAEIAEYVDYCRRGLAVAEDLINYFWEYPVIFGYLMRSSHRGDIIRLLGSDIHTKAELPAITSMRAALRRSAARTERAAATHQ